MLQRVIRGVKQQRFFRILRFRFLLAPSGYVDSFIVINLFVTFRTHRFELQVCSWCLCLIYIVCQYRRPGHLNSLRNPFCLSIRLHSPTSDCRFNAIHPLLCAVSDASPQRRSLCTVTPTSRLCTWRHQTQARCVGRVCRGGDVVIPTAETFAYAGRSGHGVGDIRMAGETLSV